jgi:hypothetical protein
MLAAKGGDSPMKRFVLALLLALPVVALAATAYAECSGTHGASSSDQIATPAPSPTRPPG